jgi:CHAD domain-containing protein
VNIQAVEMPVEEQSLAILADDTMPEAARKILQACWLELRTYEAILRQKDEAEAVHKMRVLTRRIRSIYRILDEYLPDNYLLLFPTQIRRTARLLGAVRDLDVFLLHTQTYIDLTRGESLAGLFAQAENERQKAWAALQDWFLSENYRMLAERLALRLEDPTDLSHLHRKTDGLHYAYEVRLVLPKLLYSRDYALRRYDSLIHSQHSPTLHAMRKDAKRFRYLLDAFQNLLGAPGQALILELKGLQELLGEINDGVVALGLVDDWQDKLPPTEQARLTHYRDFLKDGLAEGLARLPGQWEHYNRSANRRALAEAVANF